MRYSQKSIPNFRQQSLLRAKQHLQAVLPEIGVLMAERFAEVGVPVPDSNLDQNGLRDGAEIVKEYIGYNEFGLAFEHLCYMVVEAQLSISEQTYAALEVAGSEMGMDPQLWQRFAPKV